MHFFFFQILNFMRQNNLCMQLYNQPSDTYICHAIEILNTPFKKFLNKYVSNYLYTYNILNIQGPIKLL